MSAPCLRDLAAHLDVEPGDLGEELRVRFALVLAASARIPQLTGSQTHAVHTDLNARRRVRRRRPPGPARPVPAPDQPRHNNRHAPYHLSRKVVLLMLTLPLFLILLICAFVSVKYGKSNTAGMVLGVLLGLSLASTSVGPPLLGALTDLSSTVVSAVTSAVGGA